MDTFLPLRYVMPETVFDVRLTRRGELRPVEGGHVVHEVREVGLAASAVADRRARYEMTVDTGFLEHSSAVVDLSDDGVIQSIKAESSRSPAPIIDLVAELLPVAANVFFLSGPGRDDGGPEPSTVEEEWARTHPRLATAYEGLLDRVGRMTDRLLTDLDAAETTSVAGALRALRGELALVDRGRREWVAARAGSHATSSWRLRSADVVRLAGAHELPERTTITPSTIPVGSRSLLDHGLAIVMADSLRTGGHQPDRTAKDVIFIRRARPVHVGVYQVVGDLGEEWELRTSANLDLVDEHSQYDSISLQGRWFEERSVELAFHPDHSTKTWGITSTSTAGAVATSLGGLAGGLDKAWTTVTSAPGAQEEALERAKLELDLLKTADEYARLSATQERAAELAELEQRVKLGQARTALGG